MQCIIMTSCPFRSWPNDNNVMCRMPILATSVQEHLECGTKTTAEVPERATEVNNSLFGTLEMVYVIFCRFVNLWRDSIFW